MKTFIITLTSSDLSNRLSNDCITQASKFGITPIVWPAVNGKLDGEKKIKEYNIKPFMIPHLNVPGVIGCFLSHFELWQHCVKINEPILILEHDGFILKNLPDNIDELYLDVLQLDPYSPLDKEYANHVLQHEETVTSYDPPASGSHETGEFVIGAYGYCIKPHAAKKLVEFALTVGSLPADVHIGRKLVDIKCTSSSILRLHPHYNQTTIHTDSTTANLEKFLNKK